jgi:predicted HTH domain antitoxin
MVLKIDDELLRRLDVTEEDVRIEVFVRLFDQGKLSFGRAAELAGITQDRMYAEIKKRGIPRYRYTEEDFDRDVKTLSRLEADGFFEKRP